MVPRNQGDSLDKDKGGDQLADKAEGKTFEKDMIVTDPKRRRLEPEIMGNETGEIRNGPIELDGPKNLTEAGPAMQACLDQ